MHTLKFQLAKLFKKLLISFHKIRGSTSSKVKYLQFFVEEVLVGATKNNTPLTPRTENVLLKEVGPLLESLYHLQHIYIGLKAAFI